MKVTDLMVGDWIQVKRGFDGHLTNEKIKGLLDDDSEPYPIILTTEETVSLDDIVPIPLTEEILVKNGFERDENNQCIFKQNFKPQRFEIEYIGWSDGRWASHHLVIKYIHQLQHMLRIVGVQKEIEL